MRRSPMRLKRKRNNHHGGPSHQHLEANPSPPHPPTGRLRLSNATRHVRSTGFCATVVLPRPSGAFIGGWAHRCDLRDPPHCLLAFGAPSTHGKTSWAGHARRTDDTQPTSEPESIRRQT